MGVELRPLGIQCNISCQYCYQHSQRDARNLARDYDLEAMKAALARENGRFTLFGGEPLMVDEKDLEELWAWGHQKHRANSIQTNATLINDNIIRMFRQYNVHVGISIDGPGELNDARWVGDVERTRLATMKTEQAIARLCQEGIVPSLIVTLHRNNATADKLPLMHQWFRQLEALGVTSVRLHILETDNWLIHQKYGLSAHENVAALLSFARLESALTTLKFDVFQDMRNMLLCRDSNTTCTWMACDPYTTSAVRGIEGHGQTSNCGRINKDGIGFSKADQPGYERYIALYHTPQEYGGCHDCRFFLVCKGQCPGTAIDGDWRNRTQDCEVWKELISYVETDLIAKGVTPVSVHPNRRFLEEEMLKAWTNGSNPTMQKTLERMRAASKQQG